MHTSSKKKERIENKRKKEKGITIITGSGFKSRFLSLLAGITQYQSLISLNSGKVLSPQSGSCKCEIVLDAYTTWLS